MSIVTQIQTIINDSGVFWPTTGGTNVMFDAINEAQMWVFAQTKWSRTSASLTLGSGVDMVAVPSTILIPGWIVSTSTDADGNVDKTRAFPTTQRELENFLRVWRGAAQGKPTNFVIWDAFHLRVFPKPDKVYSYTLWGVGYPTEITDTTTSLSGPPTYVQAVQNKAVSLLLGASRPDLSQVFEGIATSQVESFKRSLRNNQSHNVRRLRPGQRFDIQQSGTIRELPVYYPVEA